MKDKELIKELKQKIEEQEERINKLENIVDILYEEYKAQFDPFR